MRAGALAVVAAALFCATVFAGERWVPPPSSRRLSAPDSEVRLLVPAFGGDDVGVSVSTVLNLQVWQTLRIPSTGDGQGTSGVVVWSDELPQVQMEVALESARQSNSQLVLWGEAVPYADGTVVQAFLTLPEQARRRQEWRITIIEDYVAHQFSVDFPSRHFQFEPIVLSNDVVERYRTPADLKIYSQPAGGAVKGSIGPQMFRAHEHHGDTVRVSLENGISGWLRLPKLSGSRSEVVDFTAGVIRILRHDWSGAKRMLTPVIDNRRTPTAIRIDALLLRAQASINSGGEWREDVARALRLNPYETDTIAYAIMFNLAEAADARSTEAKRAAIVAAAKIAKANRLLFADDDPLIKSMDRLAGF